MTLICVPILFETVEEALAAAREARDSGADLVEFRIDAFFSGAGGAGGAGEAGEADDETQAAAIAAMVTRSPLPCIITCRPVLEGGHYDGPDASRIALFERLTAGVKDGERPPDYLDVELATYQRSANIKQKVNLAIDHPSQVRDVRTGLILSTHDFHTRPTDLLRQVDTMMVEPASRIVKVAYRARSIRDDLELLDLAAEAAAGGSGKPMIALGMGPFGMLSRVVAPKFGAFLTFASMRRDAATAPGQPTIRELTELYRFKSITSATRVYGIAGAVGPPMDQSLSPVVHNAGFEALGHDGVYVPLPIGPEWEQFKASVTSLIEHSHLDLGGLSVTTPHKEHLVRLARESRDEGDNRWTLDALSERCGAGNTLVVKRDSRGRAERLAVHNTDGPAFLAAIDAAAGSRVERIALLGAGGTARAVAAAAMMDGRHVAIWNRTPQRAHDLVSHLHDAGGRVSALDKSDAIVEFGSGAVVNATSAGMAGSAAEGQTPVPDAILRNLPPFCLVLDGVYRPLRTPWLVAAAGAGLKTIDGLAVFVRQAGEQFQLWTGHAAPMGLFERAARETAESREGTGTGGTPSGA